MKIRVGWEFYSGNPICAALHCDLKLFASGLTLYPITDEQKDLVETLESVHGIVSVRVRHYEIVVCRANVMTWEEVCPSVEQALASWHGGDVTIEKTAASSGMRV